MPGRPGRAVDDNRAPDAGTAFAVDAAEAFRVGGRQVASKAVKVGPGGLSGEAQLSTTALRVLWRSWELAWE